MSRFQKGETICALITPPGVGAVGVIRISGSKAIEIVSSLFQSNKKDFKLTDAKTQTVHFGKLMDGNMVLDEVLVTIFRSPHSYTGEDVAEISCHGSGYIRQRLLELLQSKGALMAKPGEFTLRAFLNGKLDLSQAEAVADIIASENKSALQAAMQQMRGGYSEEIKLLREELIRFAALIELELDFGEEDVEFANREELKTNVETLLTKIKKLLKSFELGNILKNGIPVVIAGKPNVGKSTLLNTLINDERAIVSDIAGTTRDTIEEEFNLNGIRFRFIDTAGIRSTDDTIESIGVERTFQKAAQAAVILYLFDPRNTNAASLTDEINELKNNLHLKDATADSHIILIANKADLFDEESIRKEYASFTNLVILSAKHKTHLDLLRQKLLDVSGVEKINLQESLVTNARHAQSLRLAEESLHKVLVGLDMQISNDLIASDIRYAISQLGEITGQVSSEDLLDFIFSKFCIGK